MPMTLVVLALPVTVLGACAGAGGAGQPSGSEPLRWVDGPHGRLRVLDAGSGGVPVVFVHSLAGQGGQWAAQLAHLAPERRVVALDLTGHGESDRLETGAYSLAAAASDVAAVADALGLDRFVLVGHSLGGGVIAEYAARHPDRVAGLLFVDPIGRQVEARQEIETFVVQLRAEYRNTIEGYWESILDGARPETLRQVMADLGRAQPDVVVSALASTATFDPVPGLTRWDGPMLSVVTPDNDFPFSLHNAVPGLEAETVTGTSHWLHMDRPDAFNGLLDRFLERVRSSP